MALIAREGWPYIGGAVLAGVAVHQYIGALAAAPLWLLTVSLLFVFRDPERKIPSLPLAVLSPVDGVVVTAETVQDAYLDRKATDVGIRMNWYGGFTVRSPVEGKVVQRWYTTQLPGPRGKLGRRARYGIWVQTDEKDDVVIVMTGGVVWPRPRCYVQYGERLGQGQRCGFVHFGARVNVLVPVGTRIEVECGESVGAGTSSLGTLIHRTKS